MMLDYLKRERSGASTFEFTLVSPFMIILVFSIFVIMLMLFSWVSYGAAASTIANDLNIRSTGLITANKAMASTGEVIINGEMLGKPMQIRKSQFEVNGSKSSAGIQGSYRNALMYSAAEHADQFYFPYTNPETVEVDAYIKQTDDANINASKNLSNYVVKVDIKYNFLPIKILGWEMPGPRICATGYGVVA